jgi:hypothetical protein
MYVTADLRPDTHVATNERRGSLGCLNLFWLLSATPGENCASESASQARFYRACQELPQTCILDTTSWKPNTE